MKVLSKKLIFWLINACLSGVIFFMTLDYRSLVKLDQSYLVFFSILTFFIVLANVLTNYIYSKPKYGSNLSFFFWIWGVSMVLVFLFAFYLLVPNDYVIN